jgi:hypothetical protein
MLSEAHAQGTFLLITAKTMHAGKLSVVSLVQFVLTAPFTMQAFSSHNTNGLETKLALLYQWIYFTSKLPRSQENESNGFMPSGFESMIP